MANRLYAGLLIALCLVAFCPNYALGDVLSEDSGPTVTYSDTHPVSIPLKVQVILLGFNGDGPYKFVLQPYELESLLIKGLSKHQPHCLQTEEPIHVSYDISYEVTAPAAMLSSYESYLRNALKKKVVDGVEVEGEYVASINSLEGFFDKQPSRSGVYTVYIVHPLKERLVGKIADMNYTYALDGSGAAQSWVGSGRYVVIDLSAGPTKYGKSTEKSEGVVDYDSYPRLIEYFLPEGYAGTSIQGASKIEIRAQLTSLIISSIRYVFAADLKFPSIPFAEKVLVPVIVFRDHTQYNLFEHGINMENIRSEALRLALPGQTIQVVSANHYLHEHPHISGAVSKAIKTASIIGFSNTGEFKPIYRPYLDSTSLAHHLRGVSDLLASGLIGSDNTYSNNIKNVFYNANLPPGYEDSQVGRSQGTKVVPVYVFSLTGFADDLLLDKYNLMASMSDMVLVLHTNDTTVTVPFFEGKSPVFVNPSEATKHIVAGLAHTLGGMAPPTRRYSPLHNREIPEFLWAQGNHPFGHFTNSTRLSQIFVDSVLRNSIISHIDLAQKTLEKADAAITDFRQQYIVDPIEEKPEKHTVVKRLETDLKGFYSELNQLSELIADPNGLKTAHKQSSMLEITTRRFLSYVQNEISQAESAFLCCLLAHDLKPKPNSYFVWIVVVGCVVGASYFASKFLSLGLISTKSKPPPKKKSDIHKYM